MSIAISRRTLARLLLLAVVLVAPTSADAVVLVLRSGNATPGNPDPLVSRYDLANSCGVGWPSAFTAAEFAAADAGPPAVVLSYIHPAWAPSLACDPLARWVGVAPGADPISTLFAIDFELPDRCCYDSATLDFCWMADDGLGDGVNPAGVYLNGTPLAAITGGNFAAPTTVTGIDILPLVHCGTNTLYVYDRDVACAVSGAIWSAQLKLEECTTPARPSSWGGVKATYR
jgi:hypothetical protein